MSLQSKQKQNRRYFEESCLSSFRSATDNDDSCSGLENVTNNLLTNPTLCAAFPNLVHLAALSLVLPVTTATTERTFSDMKLTKNSTT